MDESYGQFCTVARGAEAVCERWTPLVVRELLCGSRRFNDIRRGVPRMSTSLLAQRLRHLEEIGVLRRIATGRGCEYALTEAGEALRPIVLALGHWGARWIGSRLKDDELDAGFLMWDVRRFARTDRFPDRPQAFGVFFGMRFAHLQFYARPALLAGADRPGHQFFGREMQPAPLRIVKRYPRTSAPGY